MCLVVNVHFYTLEIFERRQLPRRACFLAMGSKGGTSAGSFATDRIGGRNNVAFFDADS